MSLEDCALIVLWERLSGKVSVSFFYCCGRILQQKQLMGKTVSLGSQLQAVVQHSQKWCSWSYANHSQKKRQMGSVNFVLLHRTASQLREWYHPQLVRHRTSRNTIKIIQNPLWTGPEATSQMTVELTRLSAKTEYHRGVIHSNSTRDFGSLESYGIALKRIQSSHFTSSTGKYLCLETSLAEMDFLPFWQSGQWYVLWNSVSASQWLVTLNILHCRQFEIVLINAFIGFAHFNSLGKFPFVEICYISV